MLSMNETNCPCGKAHINPIDEILIGKGVVENIVRIMDKYEAKKAFVLSDKNTYRAAGERVCSILKNANKDFVSFTLNSDTLEPDEYSVGSVIMYYDAKCDIIIGVAQAQ